MVDTEPEDAFTLVCKAIRNGGAVIWAGAGLSAYAGYPVGTAFARILADEIGEFQSTETLILPDVAERYEVVKGRDALLDKISEVFGKEPTSVETHRKLSLIKRIPFIVTTNYDRLFETAYGDGIISIVSEQELSKTKDQGWGDRKPLLYKLHGDVDHPDQLVITRTDYKRFEKESFLWKRISTLPVEYPIIFIGYSLNDENTRSLLDNIFERLGPREQPYIIITKKAETDDQEWYQKHNVIWIEKDAVEAIKEIFDNVTQHSFLDSQEDPIRMTLSRPLFNDRKIEFLYKVDGTGIVTGWTTRVTDPTNTDPIKMNLHFSANEQSPDLIQLYNLLTGRSFDSVRLERSVCPVKLDLEANGILLADPEAPPSDWIQFKPNTMEEKEVDLQIGPTRQRLSKIPFKRFYSQTNGKIAFEMPSFDLEVTPDRETGMGEIELRIHHFTDIERGLEIYTFFKAWVDGESILVIPSDSEKPWEIPPLIQKEPSMCDFIRFWHQIHQDLSDIQRAAYVRLRLPEEVTKDECQVIADAAALIRGERHFTGEITMPVLLQFPDAARILTNKPVNFEYFGPDFKESFEIFGVLISLPVVVGGRGVVLSNLEEARADVERGADTISLRYDGSVGELYQRYIPRSPQTDKEEMKTS